MDKKKRHKWGKESRMISECKVCKCLRDRKQLTPTYETWEGERTKYAPPCK